MRSKSLAQSNRHLKNPVQAKKLLSRCVASSTAIETGESISKIEAKLTRSRSIVNRVKLA